MQPKMLFEPEHVPWKGELLQNQVGSPRYFQSKGGQRVGDLIALFGLTLIVLSQNSALRHAFSSLPKAPTGKFGGPLKAGSKVDLDLCPRPECLIASPV